MRLKEDSRTVQIEGEIVNPFKIYKEKINIEMSILQLAKVWGTDRKAVSKVENEFGSEELEDLCEETKEEIKNFPIEFWNKEIKCGYVNTTDKTNDRDSPDMKTQIVRIYGEDLCGWDNEGILVEIPKEIYDKELKGKKIEMILEPVLIKLRENKK